MLPPPKPTVSLPAAEPAVDASASPRRKLRNPDASEKLAGLKPLFGHKDARKPSIGKIFVRIPSYRDPELAPTLADMIAKADRPRDLSFGICLQDDGEMKLPDLSSAGRVHWQRFAFSQSLGVGWARHLCETMYGGEEFTLSLDSHHRFVPGWDRILLRMAESLGHDRYVITSYPPAYDPAPGGLTFEQTPNTIVCMGLSEHGTTIREPAPLTQFLYQARPMETAFYAAGFAFSSASFLSEVPADPDIYFQGEEDAMAVRAYTHGYRLYCPHRILCWHLYGRIEQPHHWSDHVDGKPEFKDWNVLERAGIARFRKLVGIDPRSDADDFAGFDLGHERTLDDYEAFAGFAYPRPRPAQSRKAG